MTIGHALLEWCDLNGVLCLAYIWTEFRSARLHVAEQQSDRAIVGLARILTQSNIGLDLSSSGMYPYIEASFQLTRHCVGKRYSQSTGDTDSFREGSH